jgi:hypothetical protein
MMQRRIFGVFLLLISLVLAILLSAKVPFVRNNKLLIDNHVEVPFGASNFYNLTLEPLGKEDYHVEIGLSPVNSSIQIDFWAVNATWLGPLIEFVSADIFQPDYPDSSPFNLIKTYAKKINITDITQFELTSLDHNGTYCLVLINFFENTQYVSIGIEERYVEPLPRALLEPNSVNIAIAAAIAIAAMYFLVTGSKRPAKRAKEHMRRRPLRI